jgi:hypothetical protein
LRQTRRRIYEIIRKVAITPPSLAEPRAHHAIRESFTHGLVASSIVHHQAATIGGVRVARAPRPETGDVDDE